MSSAVTSRLVGAGIDVLFNVFADLRVKDEITVLQAGVLMKLSQLPVASGVLEPAGDTD
jgi:hypothetical protein